MVMVVVVVVVVVEVVVGNRRYGRGRGRWSWSWSCMVVVVVVVVVVVLVVTRALRQRKLRQSKKNLILGLNRISGLMRIRIWISAGSLSKCIKFILWSA